MKRFFFIFTLFFACVTIKAQDFNDLKRVNIQQDTKVSYRLFPTSNFWTFLKLDTRTGQIWQVHFDVEGGNKTGEIELNFVPLASKRDENKGRFTLYATNNFYNFIMVDQVDGRTYQVQWSFESNNRGIKSINSKGNEDPVY